MVDQLDALESSVARLRGIAEGLGVDQLREPGYPTEWSVADVLSHIGSAAVIMQLRLDAALTGDDLADGFAQPIWDEWNAKSDDAKAADGLASDRALLERIESLTHEERSRFSMSMGPITVDYPQFIGLRLNEHALHTWDVEVAIDPLATLPPDATELIIDNVAMIARFTGKAAGSEHDLHVRTTEPTRDFTLSLGGDAVSLTPRDDGHAPDLELPAEALIRLVYGRLDADHTPPVRGNADLDELRRTFPGV